VTWRRSLAPLVVVTLIALATLSLPVAAQQDVYSERTLEIARRLQCPVCAGESVADSNSELARQMRGIIEEQVQAGRSDEQIIQFFVERYGQSIVVEPPKSGFSLALWWLPVVVVLVGALVVGLYLRERTNRGASHAADDDDAELEALAREVLDAGPADRTART
jgi:cytochrome c-type biogenesis protein CcmH